MVNSMVKLQFRVNHIVLVSIRNSYDIDGDLNNAETYFRAKTELLDPSIEYWRTRWTSILFELYVDTFWESGKELKNI